MTKLHIAMLVLDIRYDVDSTLGSVISAIAYISWLTESNQLYLSSTFGFLTNLL